MKVSIEAPESFQTLPTGTQAQLLKQTEYFLKQQVKASDKNEDSDKFVRKVESLPLVSTDQHFPAYDVELIW